MLGVCLLFVGIVLINNGICNIYGIDGKSAAVMNFLTGSLSLFINFVNLVQGNYYAAGTGLLFCFTYLFVGIPAWGITPDIRWALIWYLWAILWGTAFVEDICGKSLGKFTPRLQVFEGVVTAWVPGVLMLLGMW